MFFVAFTKPYKDCSIKYYNKVKIKYFIRLLLYSFCTCMSLVVVVMNMDTIRYIAYIFIM